MSVIPLSLYIHVPWCVRKCPYCDFNSHQQNGELPEAAYVDALLQDLEQDSHYIQGRTLHSIFIGGGTPSLFSAAAYDRLLNEIQKQLPFADDIEITLEANPGTFEQEKFSDYRRVGINRLSIGIQSFDAAHLQTLGRIHGRDEALRAADIARNAGFDNFNLDLMFGLSGQSTEQALQDLQLAMNCQPAHLSWYQLTIEPNTEYFRRPPPLPADDAIAEMQDAGMALLASQGFQRYEISAYSQSGKPSRHNLNYWEFGDYLGIGAGAHGKITVPQADGISIVRTRKTRMPQHYLDAARSFTAETKPVPAVELPLEFMMNALRLSNGVETELFQPRTGLPLSTIDASLQQLRQRQLLQATRIAPTPLGLQFLNEVLLEFM
ncbi:MAG: radical SAM family heme chaperone HemW [Pseudomonadota bacterium]